MLFSSFFIADSCFWVEKKNDEDFASIFRTTESERWIPGKGHHHLSVDVLVRGGKLPLSKTPMFFFGNKMDRGEESL